MSYSKYETIGGLPDAAATYSRLLEHLRLASECCYTLGHLRKAQDNEIDKTVGAGFLGIGQLLEKTCDQVTVLATGKTFHS